MVDNDPSAQLEPATTGADASTDITVDAMVAAAEELADEHGLAATVDGRLLLLRAPVPGSPHLAALQALGSAAGAGLAPVGAAAHGPAGVAAAVWLDPELYICRWTGSSRWVAGYRFPPRARPDDYVRDDGGIPSRLGQGSWYTAVPDNVAEAFFDVGLLLDEPPFPVPAPPAPTPAPVSATSSRTVSTTSRVPRTRASPAARPQRPATPPPAPRRLTAPATRTCSGCNLQKHPSQFIPDSELCVDCR